MFEVAKTLATTSLFTCVFVLIQIFVATTFTSMLWILYLHLNSDICIVSNHLHTVVGNLVSPGLSCLRLNPIAYRINLNNVLYHNILENYFRICSSCNSVRFTSYSCLSMCFVSLVRLSKLIPHFSQEKSPLARFTHLNQKHNEKKHSVQIFTL